MMVAIKNGVLNESLYHLLPLAESSEHCSILLSRDWQSHRSTLDQHAFPVVLLNSGYQLLNYIINERLKRIVEQTNVLEPAH